jgi:hypothetical protein
MKEEDEITSEQGGAGDEVVNRDVEATARPQEKRMMVKAAANNDKQMNRTISFQDGQLAPSEVRKRRRGRRARAASITSSIGTTDEEMMDEEEEEEADDDDDELLNDTDTQDGYDDDDDLDDGRSSVFTETSEVSEDDLDEEGDRRSIKSRITPEFIRRRRLKRRRRRREEKARYEQEDENIKSYRRTPVLTGVIAPFSIMLEVCREVWVY